KMSPLRVYDRKLITIIQAVRKNGLEVSGGNCDFYIEGVFWGIIKKLLSFAQVTHLTYSDVQRSLNLIISAILVGQSIQPDGESTPESPFELAFVPEGVLLAGELVELTPTERELLAHFTAHPNEVLSRDDIALEVFKVQVSDTQDLEGEYHRVNTAVLRLRRKLGKHAGRLVTIRNRGYKLVI
ncbi:MAG: winged helix-turn-helix domain-containing protein, partial [Chloroflexota bacterium]